MTKEVKIGLIGIAALAMLIFGINYLKGINMFQSANYYYVEYRRQRQMCIRDRPITIM